MKKYNLSFIIYQCLFIICIIGLSSSSSIAQSFEDFGQQSFQTQKVVIPPAPNAASLGNFGEYSVSNYTGALNLSIPIYTLQGRSLSHSLSLSYNGSGSRVKGVPSWVGIGWNLNAGGVISRTVMGNPDSYENYYGQSPFLANYCGSGGSFSGSACGTRNILDSDTYYIIEEKINKGLLDVKPDIYNLSANGISATFIIKPQQGSNPEIVQKEDNGLKITPVITSGVINRFYVTDQNGIKYTFDITEKTTIHTSVDDTGSNQLLADATFNSSWYLSEIESPNTSERLLFTYKNEAAYYQLPFNYDEYKTYSQIPNGSGTDCPSSGQGGFGISSPPSIEAFDRKFLTDVELYMGAVLLEKIELSSSPHNYNPGVSDLKLDFIKLRDRADQILLNWSFTYDNTVCVDMNRLVLTKFQEVGGAGADLKPPYEFNYYDQDVSLPDFTDNGMDHWGYYNGESSNTHLIPNPNIYGITIPGGGAIRNPSFSHTRIGVMETITYPTGGNTQFFYELNTAEENPLNPDIVDPGGLRVQRAINKDGNGDFINGKKYEYFEGVQFSPLVYTTDIINSNKVCCLGCGQIEINTCTNISVAGSSNIPIQSVQGGNVGYTKVEITPIETESGMIGNIGKSIAHYSNGTVSQDNYLGDVANGQMRKSEVQDVAGVTLNETVNTYLIESVSPNNSYSGLFPKPLNCQDNYDELWETIDLGNGNPGCFWTGCGDSLYTGSGNSTFQKTEYGISSFEARQIKTRLLSSTTTESFVSNGQTNSITKTITYAYNDDNVTGPTEMTLSGPGVNYTTRVKYASEFPQYALAGNDMFSTMVETKKYASGSILIGGTIVEYPTSGTDIEKLNPEKFRHILPDNSEFLMAEVLDYNAHGYPMGYQRYTSEFLHPETYTWENGNIKTITVANQTQTFNYYPNWKQVEEVFAADGTQSYYEYDDLQRLELTKSKYNHGTGEYQVESMNGYSYSPNQVSSTTAFFEEQGDPPTPNQTSLQTFDGIGRPLTTVVNGILKNQIIYDDYGRVEYQTYLPGSFKQLLYQPNPLGRVIQEIYPDNSSISMIYEAEGGYKNTVIDENGHPSISVTDILGRTIRVEDALGNITSYAYDIRGNLAEVSPPNASEVGESYLYQYDLRNRLIEKVIPGGATHTYEYNEADMMVGADNGNGMIVTVYDLFGRPVETGFGSFTAPNTYNFSEYLTETFYDNPILVSSFPNNSKSTDSECSSIASKGKVVGTKVKILDSDDWIYTTTCYDQYGRSIVTNSTNHLDGNDEVTSNLNMANLPTSIEREHNVPNIPMTEIYESFTYDGLLRTQSTSHQIGNLSANEMTINFNTYNDLDQLVTKRIGAHPSEAIDFLQNITYLYNTRGWLTHINDISSTPGEEAIEACNEVIDCPPECTYNTLVDFGESDKFSNYITDITYIKWNVPFSIPLAYPYEIKMDSVSSASELFRLSTDLNNWLNTEAYPALSIQYEITNEGRLKIIIYETKTEFDNIFTTADLSGINNPVFGGSIATPWEQDCTLPPFNCKECYDIYKICPCPLSFKDITPTRIRVEYDHAAISGSTIQPSLVRITETGIYTNLDGTTLSIDRTVVRAIRSINANGDLDVALGLEEDVPLTGDYTHVMEIDLTSNFAATFDLFKSQVGTLLANEISSAGISIEAAAEMEATIMEATAETWLEELLVIPSASSSAYNPPLFSMELVYGTPHAMVDALPQHNGNISGMIWKTAGRTTQSYSFLYDDINRLIDGLHQEDTGEDDYVKNNYNVEMTYDNMGNIMTLYRNGVIDRGICPEDPTMSGYTFGRTDSLEYSYTNKSTGELTNRLQRVDELTDINYGYKGAGGGYDYDGSGNITRDHNKGVSIDYNHLNLPNLFTFDTGGTITITYDAAGIKLKKEVQGTESYTLHYIGGIEYREEAAIKIESIHHAEGRVTYDENDEAQYEYHLKDHLGNVRIAFADKNGDGYIEPFSVNPNEQNGGSDGTSWNLTNTEILQESHYYPFGMDMDGAWQDITNDPENKYLYNGKELNSDFGLDWSDYGARWYDPAIARWISVDPVAEEYVQISSYAYVANMPIRAIDPDGRRMFFVGGANNDQDGWNYITRWGDAFTRSGVQSFVRINASSGKTGDILFTNTYRSKSTFSYMKMGKTPYTPEKGTKRASHNSITSAVNQIKANLKANPLAEDEQLNLAGYSFGSVLQAQAALKLADEGTYIDNLILIGSPISDNSELFKSLSSNSNIGNVIRVDIEKDLLSNPSDAIEYLKGAKQNSGDDGPHFDLARPGEEVDRNIQIVIDWLKEQGVK